MDLSMMGNYFAKDYATARARFLESAERSGAEVHSIPVKGYGPVAELLTTDIAWLGRRDAEHIVIHTCGVHGVEAFSGSAIQLNWMDRGPAALPENTAVMLVHAVNPFGMAWLRRFNLNNVDLNRNYRTVQQFAPKEIPNWRAIDRLLNRPGPMFRLRAALLIARHGMKCLRTAVGGGQTLNPRGLFWAGNRVQEELVKYERFLREHCGHVRRVVVVDVHTGLGRFGEDALLVEHDAEVLREAFGSRVQALGADTIAYEAPGSQEALYRSVFGSAELYFVTQEFGTYSPLQVVEALRGENLYHGSRGWWHVWAPEKQKLRMMFDPQDARWRAAVLYRGEDVITRALKLVTVGKVSQAAATGSEGQA
ncbi:MAG: hypothetical protein RL328_2600 [Acidobacteriota bacterium]|jgi:hypothetical protein